MNDKELKIIEDGANNGVREEGQSFNIDKYLSDIGYDIIYFSGEIWEQDYERKFKVKDWIGERENNIDAFRLHLA